MSTFDSTKTPLPDIIRQITTGKLQLPDFQRGWVWDDQHVCSLLVSIARSFPVGAVMLLETGGDIKFQTRPVENVQFQGLFPEPERLILDGQQRLTSLTQVLALDTPVKTFNENKKKVNRYYYININLALENEQLEEAFISIDEDKKARTNFGRDIFLDLSTLQKEFEEFYFPCNQILNSDSWEARLAEYDYDKLRIFMKFREKVLSSFRRYQLPLIVLDKSTSKEAVCLVFEKVNTGGVPLSVFDLVTASFAAENYNLRDDWYGNALRKLEGRAARIKTEAVLKEVEPTAFLQAISLLQTYNKRQADLKTGKPPKTASAVSAKRVSVLSLSLADYKQWAPEVEKGFILAAKFLYRECFFKSYDLPYRTQLIPLAAVLACLKERWLEPKIYNKLCKWFWCGVLGELYGGAVESRIANDVEELLSWVGNPFDADEDDLLDGNPRTITEASFRAGRLETLRTRVSAAYKGINTLVLRQGAKDFFWKSTVKELDHEEMALDIHHIFPKAWCEDKDIKAEKFDSIINKTPISYKANRMIGRKAPSEYLALIQSHNQVGLSNPKMDEILVSHFIDATALRDDDFERFYEHRQENLLCLIEKAMGKSIDRGLVKDDEINDHEP